MTAAGYDRRFGLPGTENETAVWKDTNRSCQKQGISSATGFDKRSLALREFYLPQPQRTYYNFK